MAAGGGGQRTSSLAWSPYPMSWGGIPGAEDHPELEGTSVNALIDTDANFEAINAMPHMSALPVSIRKAA